MNNYISFYLPRLIISDVLLKQKLLDETTSRVICASPLLYGEGHGGTMMSSQSNSTVSTSSITSLMGGMVDEGVVIFITNQSALVVMTLDYHWSLYLILPPIQNIYAILAQCTHIKKIIDFLQYP